MAFTTYTLTGNVSTLIGTDYATDNLRVVLESSEPMSTDGSSEVRVGGIAATLAADGTFTITGIPSSVLGYPLYRVVIEWRDLGDRGKPRTAASGYFEMLANSTLAAKVLATVTPQVISPTVAANIAAAAALGATNDTATGSYLANPASATRVAGDAVYLIPAAELIYYVSPRGNNSNSGRSWGQALATVYAALTAIGSTQNARIEIGTGTITETTAWGTIPQGTTINGSGKIATKINKQFNGHMFTPGQGVTLANLTIDGQGATYTGRIANITGTLGGQTFDKCKLFNSDEEAIWFGYQAGSGFVSTNCDIWRYNSASGTERYAIVVENTTQLSAVPRTFHALASGGQSTFNFGASNDTFVSNSFLNDIKYTSDSRGVNISCSRLASPKAIQTLDGSNNTIVGCDVYSSVQIQAGSGGNCVGPNAYQNIPLDLSGLATNKVIHENASYTPTFVTASTATTLGNAVITGFYARNGSIITATIDITIGSTTTVGTGEIRVGLPSTRSGIDVTVCGSAILFPAGGSTQYTAIAQSIGANAYVRLIRDTSGVVTPISPHAAGLATGSNLRVVVTYRA